MASLLFDDISFPTELYNKDGTFTQVVQDLLDFAPKVAHHYTEKEVKESNSENPENLPQIPSQISKLKQSLQNSTSKNWKLLKDVVEIVKPVVKDVVEVATPLVQEYVKLQIAQASQPVVNITSGETSEQKRKRQEMEDEIKALHKREELRKREMERLKQREELQRQALEKHESELKELKRTKEQQKEKEEPLLTPEQSAMLTTGLLTAGTAVISAYSTYKSTQLIGYTQFLHQFNSLLEEIKGDVIPSIKSWIKERKELGLPVAKCIEEDLKYIQDVVELCDRLDDEGDQKRTLIGYVVSASGAAFVVASTWLGNNAGKPFGMFATAAGALWVLGNWGLRSSSVYQSSFKEYSRKVYKICKELKKDGHKTHVLFELQEMMNQEEHLVLGEKEEGMTRLESFVEEETLKIPLETSKKEELEAKRTMELLNQGVNVPIGQLDDFGEPMETIGIKQRKLEQPLTN